MVITSLYLEQLCRRICNEVHQGGAGGSLETIDHIRMTKDRSTKSSISSVDFKDCRQPGDGATIPNRNYRANRSGLILQKKIRKFAQNRQTDRQTNRDFKYRGHSYPLWIVGGSGPIVTNLQPNFLSTSFRV